MITLTRDKQTSALLVFDHDGTPIEDERHTAFMHAISYGEPYLSALQPSERLAVESFQRVEQFNEWRHAATERFRAKFDLPPFEAAVEAKLAEKFGGDRSRYAEAMEAVGAENPDLAWGYAGRTRGDATPDAGRGEQFAAAASSGTAEIEQLIDEVLNAQFGGDRAKYAEAMKVVARRYPELVDRYLKRGRKAGA